MERDQKVYVIGEEVGDYQGAYKITKVRRCKLKPVFNTWNETFLACITYCGE
jgi:pyruvate/2-oxoglutarate/acetoin dehydrogenase E1 component